MLDTPTSVEAPTREELEIGARLEQHVILPGLEHHELAGAELVRTITDAKPRRAAAR